ncbi:ATP-binding cassette domain-containing protein [Salinimonas sp. HHU 13199]|uniref:ATP-binding cassette domain-containing protein n=1 Tax=Salinimonas profundi TaxID=2729140 RepID=A0ABR8LMD9_9ALTE|nr:ATP-binding cassette domain-containing protein [Salinimonas profundi]MBD3585084.1 ATP-binding cassette domain-containing protein [Salinimonas profundi]
MITLNEIGIDKRLHGISAEIDRGMCCHILGENGAGKSTLLQVCAGLLEPGRGECRINEQPVTAMPAPRLAGFRGFHEQNSTAAFDIPAHSYIQFYAGRKPPHDKLIAALDIGRLLARPVSQLSGGEKQRVNLVRCIAQVWEAVEKGQAVLCLDEPLQGLDVRHQQSLLLFLRELCQLGNTVIMSCHDINISARFADTTLLLKNGRCLASGPVHQTFSIDLLETCFGIKFVITNNQNALQIHPQWPSA